MMLLCFSKGDVTMVRYSLIIPAHNEKENLPSLLREVVDVMTFINEPWEVIVVDDCSTDGSWAVLEFLRKGIPQLRAMRLKTQSGQSAALSIGFSSALGEYLITLDGNGQHNPYDIPRLIEAMPGVDCVSGRYLPQEESVGRRYSGFLAKATRRLLPVDHVHVSGCALQLFRAECLRHIKFYRGMHRFLPALLSIEGFVVKEIPVSKSPRNKKKPFSFGNNAVSVFFDFCAVAWMKRRKLTLTIERTLP
jgi:dolichol-phosphate mannosyltransferase